MKILKIPVMVVLALMAASCNEKKQEGKKDLDSQLDETLSVRSLDLPLSSTGTIAEELLKMNTFSTLGQGLKSTGLIGTVSQTDSLTLFAPTNDAFEKLPDGMVTDLMQSQGESTMTDILKFRLVKGVYDVAALQSKIKANDGVLMLETLQGEKIYLAEQDDGTISLTHDQERKAFVTQSDINAENGIIHGIDTVIIPN